MEAIQQKVDGQDITADAKPAGGTKILDLMEALKASLAAPVPDGEAKEARKAS